MWYKSTENLGLKLINKNYTATSAHHFTNSAYHQWWILIRRPGLVEGITVQHWTILPDLTLDPESSLYIIHFREEFPSIIGSAVEHNTHMKFTVLYVSDNY
jgi:hypothetical protein